MTDADLILCELFVLRCQRRDPCAANELVTLFEKPLLYYLRRLVGSEADVWDLVQETWMSVFRTLPKLRDARTLPAFLYRTARNHALAHLRHRDVNLRLYAAVESAATETTHEPDFTRDEAAAVHAGLDKLSLPHREALPLFFLQDLTSTTSPQCLQFHRGLSNRAFTMPRRPCGLSSTEEPIMTTENNLRENLFSSEPVSPERQQRFRQELAQIVEPRLPGSHRLYYKFCLVCLFIGLPGAVCGLIFDAEHRWIWSLNLLVLIPSTGWILHILRRGAEPLRIMRGMSKALAGITWAVALLLILYALRSPSLAGVLWAHLGLLVFLLSNFINVWNRQIMAESTMREHILRVEYRLADLATRLPPPSKP